MPPPYNTTTLELLANAMQEWSSATAAEGKEMNPYFIDLGFKDITDPARIEYFNKVPTSFKLSDEQVDKLIETGRELLRNHPVFQEFLADLG